MVSIGISPAALTAALDWPLASDKAPATPNTVTAFARLLRFEACFVCGIVETSYWLIAPHATAMCLKKSPGSEVRGYQLDYLLHHIFEPLRVRFVMYNFLWCRVA